MQTNTATYYSLV